MKDIVVAGGCFWGVDHYFAQVKGIATTNAIYANSDIENITYEQTCSGEFNAVEAVYLEYNESEISLEKIIELLFRIIDPTSLNKQAEDEGVQYRNVIYSTDKEEFIQIQKIVDSFQDQYKDPILVEVKLLENFYNAEDYHQLYLVRNKNGYCHVDFSKLKDSEKKEIRIINNPEKI